MNEKEIFGLLSWRTNGLEAASAIHSINNLMAFYIGFRFKFNFINTLFYGFGCRCTDYFNFSNCSILYR